ncbi:MAG: DUF1552 domain-containing protein [Deltaproteobacteria bacterium]|nr:DUF1552 domain-containing protein [Deltaproteobacteria bacterium]
MNAIARRRFISSLGLGVGSYFFQPLCNRIMAEAFAAPTPKLLMYITGGGFSPGDDEPGYWPSNQSGLDLGPAMTALAPLKSKAVFMESFFNPLNKHLHGNGYSTTTMVADTGAEEASQPAGVSFDRQIAKTIKGTAPLTSLNLGTMEADNNDPQHTFSADGPKALVPPMVNPIKAFEAVFGGATNVSQGDDGAAKRLLQDKSVFDGLVKDIERMNKALAASEKAKLDQYVSSVRALETQLGEVVKARASCGSPMAPSASIYAQGRKSPKLPVYKAMMGIAANALACGLTNTVSFLASEGDLDFMPLDAGGGFCGTHQMWHGKGSRADHLRYYNFQYSNIAALRQALVDLGGEALADNTLILNFCQTGGPHHNGQDRYFALFLGNPGGRLATGKYIQSPVGKRSMADVFMTAGAALGVAMPSFGSAELKASVIPGVLA